MITTEPYFDFIINKSGEMMLVLEGRQRPPHEDARLVFDGKESAALFRDQQETIYLTNMPKDVLKRLRKANNIIVAEMLLDGDIQQAYDVEVMLDKKLEKKLREEG